MVRARARASERGIINVMVYDVTIPMDSKPYRLGGRSMSDSRAMHEYALKEAVKYGPREFEIHGEKRIAFGLTRAELKALFQSKGYNITTGIRWRSTIVEWTDNDLYKDRTTMNPEIILDKRETSAKWSVLFAGITKDNLIDLLNMANDKSIKAWPQQEYWDHANYIFT